MKPSQNQYSHLTAIDRTYLSFPARFLLERNLIQGKVLDFGCGFGNDVKLLGKRKLDVLGYDPYYFPDYPKGKFSTILCFYVLNVLFPEDQARVLMEVSHLLAAEGKAYFAVRRDLKREGFREHYVHKKPTYQCRVKLPFRSIHLDESCEIYEYRPYNDCRNSNNRCLFCNPSKNLTLLTESANAYAIFDPYPMSRGHALVIPKRHTANYFDIPFEEQSACWLMVDRVQTFLKQEFNPDGFNVGINVSPAAGQKMKHASIHVIPRYWGDTGAKKGGMRSVIPK
ncbi:HIT family protein [Oscillatoria sp. FACHB-1406]|uniref:HIT family protein n=1 Tax=Oscillatoria sp. FACHB-1406 TaxID=2692846 RepID=UPI0016860C82|nr:HIT family protein [Oscillatoria sp. FACHB-1406]MBD2578595.1 HIT domain-containing protein [Oscillatoria sp. FACHB-1406]